MKTRVKLMLSAVVVLALVAFFQIETSKAGIIPVEGCKYTSNPIDYCRVGDYLWVINCSNHAETSCGIDTEDIEEINP